MSLSNFNSQSHRSRVTSWLLRIAVAAVWLYHGLWNKLLMPTGRHAEIVAAAPSFMGLSSQQLLMLIGLAEASLAVWVLSGLALRVAAVAQTVLLLLMNAGGLVWARDSISDPGAMIVQNIAFLALIWVVATREPPHGERS